MLPQFCEMGSFVWLYFPTKLKRKLVSFLLMIVVIKWVTDRWIISDICKDIIDVDIWFIIGVCASTHCQVIILCVLFFLFQPFSYVQPKSAPEMLEKKKFCQMTVLCYVWPTVLQPPIDKNFQNAKYISRHCPLKHSIWAPYEQAKTVTRTFSISRNHQLLSSKFACPRSQRIRRHTFFAKIFTK